MSEDLIRLEHSGWLELRLNRPAKLNALTPELLFGLAAELASIGDAHVVAITAAGPKAFSAGFDLDTLKTRGAAAHDGDPVGTAVAALAACPVPTIAALHGYCWGAAVELVTACDLRIAAQDTSIALPSNRLGSLYRPRGIDALARRFGASVAGELLIASARYDAQAAFARGMVTAIVADSSSYLDDLAAKLQPPAPGQHARFLREWVTRADDHEAFLAHWESVRAAAVASRVVPAVGGGS